MVPSLLTFAVKVSSFLTIAVLVLSLLTIEDAMPSFLTIAVISSRYEMILSLFVMLSSCIALRISPSLKTES